MKARACRGHPTASTPSSVNAGAIILGGVTPRRLIVIDRCVRAVGTVSEISLNPDGDLTFRLELDPAYAGLLNGGNHQVVRGYL